jgi:hypothetical protein
MWSASLFSLGWCDLQATYPSLEPLLAVSASLGTNLLDIASALCAQDKLGRFLLFSNMVTMGNKSYLSFGWKFSVDCMLIEVFFNKLTKSYS